MGKANIIRGNAQEITILNLKAGLESCIVMTGEQDQVLYREETTIIKNGASIMAKVIATGCAIGALITALASKTDCPKTASVAALLWFGVAGEMASQKTKSPGSFVPAFIDALYETNTDTLREKAKLS